MDISNNIINLLNNLGMNNLGREIRNINNNIENMQNAWNGQPITNSSPIRPYLSYESSLFQPSDVEIPGGIPPPPTFNNGQFSSFINLLLSDGLNSSEQQLQNMRNLLEQSFQQQQKYKKVISEKGLNDIIKIKFDDTIDQKDCPIFMTKFKIGEEVSQLPCKHIFNTFAIEKWLKEEQHMCPVCRYKLDYKEEEIENSLNLENMVDLSNNTIDLSNNVFDLSNNIFDLSNNVFENFLERMYPVRRNISSINNQSLENVLDLETDMLNDRYLQQAIMDSLND